MDKLNEFVELLKRAGLYRLDSNAVFIGLAREFGQEAVSCLVAEKHNTTLAQTLNGPVEGS